MQVVINKCWTLFVKVIISECRALFVKVISSECQALFVQFVISECRALFVIVVISECRALHGKIVNTNFSSAPLCRPSVWGLIPDMATLDKGFFYSQESKSQTWLTKLSFIVAHAYQYAPISFPLLLIFVDMREVHSFVNGQILFPLHS